MRHIFGASTGSTDTSVHNASIVKFDTLSNAKNVTSRLTRFAHHRALAKKMKANREKDGKKQKGRCKSPARQRSPPKTRPQQQQAPEAQPDSKPKSSVMTTTPTLALAPTPSITSSRLRKSRSPHKYPKYEVSEDYKLPPPPSFTAEKKKEKDTTFDQATVQPPVPPRNKLKGEKLVNSAAALIPMYAPPTFNDFESSNLRSRSIPSCTTQQHASVHRWLYGLGMNAYIAEDDSKHKVLSDNFRNGVVQCDVMTLIEPEVRAGESRSDDLRRHAFPLATPSLRSPTPFLILLVPSPVQLASLVAAE